VPSFERPSRSFPRGGRRESTAAISERDEAAFLPPEPRKEQLLAGLEVLEFVDQHVGVERPWEVAALQAIEEELGRAGGGHGGRFRA
jgi:hypothetical protein